MWYRIRDHTHIGIASIVLWGSPHLGGLSLRREMVGRQKVCDVFEGEREDEK